MGKTLAMLAGVMALLALGIVFFRGKNFPSQLETITSAPTAAEENDRIWNQAKSEEAARDFVLTSQSYQAGGSQLKLESSLNLLKCDTCWEFVYFFQNESGNHQMRVTLENGQIISALTDDTFNELTAAVK
ncbi:MAG: hypothetical protein ABH807_02770 [Candidatus Shapirobacteria bacterium]